MKIDKISFTILLICFFVFGIVVNYAYIFGFMSEGDILKENIASYCKIEGYDWHEYLGNFSFNCCKMVVFESMEDSYNNGNCVKYELMRSP